MNSVPVVGKDSEGGKLQYADGQGPLARPASFSPETRAHFRSVNVQSHGTHCAAAEDHNRGPQPVCTGDVWGAVGHGWGGVGEDGRAAGKTFNGTRAPT